MRRAIVATAGTVVGLVALLSYKSSGPHNGQRVQVNGGQSAPVSSTLPPLPTTGPATTGPANLGRRHLGRLHLGRRPRPRR